MDKGRSSNGDKEGKEYEMKEEGRRGHIRGVWRKERREGGFKGREEGDGRDDKAKGRRRRDFKRGITCQTKYMTRCEGRQVN